MASDCPDSVNTRECQVAGAARSARPYLARGRRGKSLPRPSHQEAVVARSGPSAILPAVVLMLENRSFDHMLGFLYTDAGNVSPLGQPFEGLTGTESNPDANGQPVSVFKIEPTTPNAYFMPGADPGEGYMATNAQLFGSAAAP